MSLLKGVPGRRCLAVGDDPRDSLAWGPCEELARWRPVHDPGKVVADLAAPVALGGDCLADIALLREQPDLAGPVASDPVVSRLVATLARDLPRSLPLSGFAQNQVWCEIAALACELLAWTQRVALTGAAPPLGTQTTTAAPALGRRSSRPQRPARATPPRPALALGRRHLHRNSPPAGHPDPLTSPDIPSTRKDKPSEPVEPRPPAAGAGQPGTA